MTPHVVFVRSIMRLFAPIAALAMAATLGLSAAQAAPVNYTATHLYGTNQAQGRIDPPGSDPVNQFNVEIYDNSTERFSDSFDFSSVNYTSISSITLTLDYRNAGPALIPSELWSVRILGSNNGGSSDDYFGVLVTLLSPTSYVLTAATDILGVNAFANAVSSEKLTFWFSEFSPGVDRFNLRSARIDIVGEVPLPAGGLLLLGALGGLAALRRRRRV